MVCERMVRVSVFRFDPRMRSSAEIFLDKAASRRVLVGLDPLQRT